MPNNPSTPALRSVARGALVTACLVLSARTGSAQGAAAGVELRPFVGAYVPTGAHRDLLRDAVLVGAQLGRPLTEYLAVTGSFGWAPAADKTPRAGIDFSGRDEDVDLYQYDLALEGRLPDLAPSTRWSSRPYAALGVGGRTYSYRDVPGVGAETNFLGFGAVGLDVAPPTRSLGVRFEVRDNVSAFKGLRGERADRTARNDVQFTAGLTFRL
jgi:hypothetical protein